MIFISSIFIFCGIALYINKKNKLYADEAGIFLTFLNSSTFSINNPL